jgi:Ca2+:H+ antiporter
VLPPRTIRFADERAQAVSGEVGQKPGPPIELGDLDASGSEIASELAESRGRAGGDTSSRPNNSQQPNSRSRGHSRSLSLGSSHGRVSQDFNVTPDRRGLMRSGITTLQILRNSRTNLDALAHEQARLRRTRNDRIASVLMLITSSVFMSMCAEFLVSVIDEVIHDGHLSESVIGLIILPIVGNIAEYVTVVTVAKKEKLDLAIAVAVGSGIQIALCVTPLTIIAGWILRRGLALTFNFFEMSTLLGTVLMVNLLILSDGSSTMRTSGLKGALMCACYLIIA